jgi:hypothetical protein
MKLFFLRKEIYHAAGCEAKAMDFIYLIVLCVVVGLFLQAICCRQGQCLIGISIVFQKQKTQSVCRKSHILSMHISCVCYLYKVVAAQVLVLQKG